MVLSFCSPDECTCSRQVVGPAEEEESQASEERQRRAPRAHNTIAKDVKQINFKKLECEYTVDPLFSKTSAEFDDGSAERMLMNSLMISDEGAIIFDASEEYTPLAHRVNEAGEEGAPEWTGELDLSLLQSLFVSVLIGLPIS